MRSEGSRLLGVVDMTHRQIASRLGVGRATVARWVSGQSVPTEQHRRAMQAAFGIPMHAWPDEWPIVRDVIVQKLSAKAPDLLEEIIEDLERMGVAMK
jgi:transcriptional regulator with XRE-family HTH domain